MFSCALITLHFSPSPGQCRRGGRRTGAGPPSPCSPHPLPSPPAHQPNTFTNSELGSLLPRVPLFRRNRHFKAAPTVNGKFLNFMNLKRCIIIIWFKSEVWMRARRGVRDGWGAFVYNFMLWFLVWVVLTVGTGTGAFRRYWNFSLQKWDNINPPPPPPYPGQANPVWLTVMALLELRRRYLSFPRSSAFTCFFLSTTFPLLLSCPLFLYLSCIFFRYQTKKNLVLIQLE